LPELWKTRENYLSTSYPESDKSYTRDVAEEIEKLLVPGAGDEIYLWFEYELFCSVNYWFCLYLLRDSFAAVCRVSPTVRDEETRWRGFGRLNSEDLLECWNDRVRLSAKDIQQGNELWQAFKTIRSLSVLEGSHDRRRRHRDATERYIDRHLSAQ
jgi:hypothetical protein